MSAPLPITPWHWAGFIVVILLFLALDLGLHRRARVVRIREALFRCVVWLLLTLLFAHALRQWRSGEESLQFLTGYLIEFSLSTDNVFAIAMIFSAFGVAESLQHRVLHWGILGALLMRGVMIAGGAALIQNFHPVLYVLGAFLLLTGVKWIFSKPAPPRPERNLVLRLARKLFPVVPGFDGERFVTVANGRRALTPLALALVAVETTDLLFAADSIPAIFAVTQNAFIVFTSNIFAVLGLRSLYFVLAGAIRYFRCLRAGLAAVLIFTGAKMLLAPWYVLPAALSLGVVAAILAVAVGISILLARREKQRPSNAAPL
jgi:tellurite resistance protein TerC